ncbi:response regulator transcription factor [Acaryochloris sp. CCMEE 5410]|uniref:response regulator n=1 Tax=Acaryochloris sp. CCMEE 5410 TaxID=310037 RepID=UPI0002484AFD|nr:response regulator transcription factor [Acaryochloris sp. CCMEE 5410]KAI9132777.1 response regulator transcription factor [Acaryochloris sp. CCMEE 5410]
MTKIQVVVIEDHDLSRVGLTAALQHSGTVDVLGSAANGRQGLEMIQQYKPDVAILDIGLPDIDGIEVTLQLKQVQEADETLHTKVLMLTANTSEDAVLAAFAAGADSYSLKEVSVEDLLSAIQLTHEGNAWIDPNIARIVLQQAKASKETPQDAEADTTVIKSTDPEYQAILETEPLTDRELEVLELIVAGCSNAVIADKLYISVGTVKTHVRSILNKLCADDRTQAAVRALRSGLVT